jgi:hypothetical protein
MWHLPLWVEAIGHLRAVDSRDLLLGLRKLQSRFSTDRHLPL